MTDDIALLERYAGQQDAEAFATLVKRHADLVFGVAFRITRNSQDAEDVTQACFLDLARNASKVTTSVVGWLHRLARWQASKFVRARVTRSGYESKAWEESHELTQDPEWAAMEPKIDEAVESLPENLRIPLILHYFEGRNQTEVAEMLGINQSTVFRHLEEAVEELRSRLKISVAVPALVGLLAANAMHSTPAAVLVSLGKIAVSGFGAQMTSQIAAGAGKPGFLAYGGVAMKAGMATALVLAVIATAVYVKKTVGQNSTAGTNGKSDKTLLGSTAFYPSPERPIGWRGDWSGKFPGATPVLSWGLWPKGPFKEMQCMADKPDANSKGTPMQHGIIKDWLIAGPVDGTDPKEDIGKSLIGDETAVEPTSGMKTGSLQWRKYGGWFKHGRGGTPMCAIETKLPGKGDDPLSKPAVFYTHSYMYSPEAASVRFYDSGNGEQQAIRLWVNGKAVMDRTPEQREPGKTDLVITLAKGWNRFLIKHCAPAKGSIKPFAIKLFPASIDMTVRNRPKPDMDSENLVWSIGTDGNSTGTPLVIGDKVIFGIERRFLVCADRNTGKIIWLRALSFFNTLPEEKRNSAKDEIARIRGLENKAGEALSLEDGSKKHVALRDVHEAYRKLEDANGFKDRMPSTEMTPCTDGQNIFHFCSGGLATCLDMDGNTVWAQAIPTHGTHHQVTSSPLLIGEKCIVVWRRFIAYDKKTGKQLWSMPAEGEKEMEGECTYASPVAFKVGNDYGLLSWSMVRASDGKRLGGFKDDNIGYASFGPCATPIVEGDVIYTFAGEKADEMYMMKRPETLSDKVKIEVQRIPLEKMNVNTRWGDIYFIASPLYHDGLIYTVGMHGGLRVLDAKAGKPLYKAVLPSIPQEGYGFKGGIDACIAMAGGNIFITDNAGTTCIIEPGREYKLKAVNSIVAMNDRGEQDTTFESTPIFVGDKMYIRGGSAMYCFGKK